VSRQAWFLRNAGTDVVEQISICKANANPGRQQHHGEKSQSRPGQCRGAANARANRRRFRPLLQALDNRRQFRRRRLEDLQFSAGAGGFNS
jgi:hypothetical protein